MELEGQETRGDKLENELKKTKDELEDLKKSMDGVKAEAVKVSMAEINERENNRNNVIIHKVPESTSNKPTERQAHDIERLQIILRELGLFRFIKDDLREHIKFIRRVGERKEQEARPLKVGFIFNSMKERLMESARYLNQLPALRHVGIAHDLTDIQRKAENSLWRKACNQNLSPTIKMQEKGLVLKVVGSRGQRRMVTFPLRRMEEVDEEGIVRMIFKVLDV